MTIKVTLATDPGPAFGLAVAPLGWWWSDGDCIAPVGNAEGVTPGAYFTQADLNADGTVTLREPPTGWQDTESGQAFLSSSGATSFTELNPIQAANAAYAAAKAAAPKVAATSGVLAPPAPGAADMGFFAGAPIAPGT